ncbi:hypothetical protein GCM10009720_08310 [Yaniella flava]|uniref:Fluoride-specific ion channel n=1 Tax=Yaniella flava TaxID=287930 RepID=A0ABN2UDR1_9MICC
MSWNVSILNFVANRVPKPRPATLAAVAVGGALGAVARVFLPWPTWLDASLTALDPLPIVFINVIGAALLGLVTGYTGQRQVPEPWAKGITTGFLGAFTTMSALAVAFIGLTAGQAVFTAGSISQGVFVALVILVGLVAFLYATTMITLGTIKLGRHLAKDKP